MALTRPALAALALLVLSTAPAAAAAPPRATSQIVVYKDAVSNAPAQTRKRERALGFTASQRYRSAIEGFAADLTPRQVENLRSDPDVARVVPDRPVSIDSVPLVPGGSLPAGIRRIGALQGSSIREASGAAVAVIDTGVDLDNPDLNVVAGTNCTGTGPPDDQHGHGTHVAGTIAARNDGTDAVGVAPGTKIYAVEVLDNTGQGTDSQVICGIDWVTTHAAALGIKVANMSLGGSGPVGSCASNPEHQAICSAVAAGVTVVAAAGNDGAPLSSGGSGHVPGAYPEVLTATAMGDTDGLPGGLGSPCSGQGDDSALAFSNYGLSTADDAHMIAAPGGCVVSSAIGGGVAIMSGTSMASPHVAGAAALCINEAGSDGPCAGLAPAGVGALLRQTAQAAATTANGFVGDPLHPGPRYYGYLVRATTPPAAVTGDADVLGETTADLAGTVDANGQPASWWFELQAGEESLTTDVQTGSPGDDPAAVQASAAGLDPGTTYSYTLVARVDGWTVRGEQKSFTTPGIAPPPAPDTQIDSGPPSLSTSGQADVAFSASGQPAAGFECAVDSAGWAVCSSPRSLSGLGDGQHTFAVRAVGAGGKKDPSPASITWAIDRTPPDTRISGGPSDPTGNRDATFGISATELGATFACRLDDEAWTPCGAVVSRGALAPGHHHFEARATDAAGLTDPTPAVYEWTITAPAAAPTSGAPEPPVADTPLVTPAPVAPLPQPAILTTRGKLQLDPARGRATLTLLCRGPGVCSGRLELRASGRKLGSASISLGAGKRKLLVVRIPRRVLKALRVRTVTLVVARGSTTRLQISRVNLLTTPGNRA